MMPHRKSWFITLEGGEGSGKSTQAKLLAAVLMRSGISTMLTREPGGTKGAEEIRTLLVNGEANRWDRITETLLFMAARRDHVQQRIKPSLEANQWVVCDRFSWSTRAYQGYGHGVDLSAIDALSALVIGGFVPDFTLLYDIDPKIGLARASARIDAEFITEDRYEQMNMAFHARLQKGFLEMAKEAEGRCGVVDASRDIHVIHVETVELISEYFSVELSPMSKVQLQEVIQGA